METILLRNIRICCEEGKLQKGSLLFKDGSIERMLDVKETPTHCKVIDGENGLALPGFIDIHIHGANGADVMDNEPMAIENIALSLPSEGTTSFLATTMTQSLEDIAKAVKRIRHYYTGQNSEGAELLGIHLEGPFIHPDKAGAQPSKFIVRPTISLLNRLFDDDLACLKIVTMAPEQDVDFNMITHLKKQDVIISAGHTTADHQKIVDAIDNGISHLTHICNAMDGIHHRKMGPVGTAILDKRLFVEVIADGVHLSKEMLKILYECVGLERILLITDAMRAKGLSDGSYMLGGQAVTVSSGMATLADGTLAGSLLKFNEGLKIFREATGATIFELKNMSSSTAAKRLGVWDRKGSIEVGKDADVVVLNDSLDVMLTFCKGRLVYQNEKM